MSSEPSRFDSEKPVDSELLARILGEAAGTPSPYNLQPWRFVVVRDAANRRRLQTLARNQPLIGQAPAVVIVLGYHDSVETDLGVTLERRLVLGACTPDRAAELQGRAIASLGRAADRPLWAIRSSMLAAGALTRAAESEGLSSAVLHEFDDEGLREEFGVPDDHSIGCLIAIGWAAGIEPFAGRLGLDETCFSEHFGQPWTG